MVMVMVMVMIVVVVVVVVMIVIMTVVVVLLVALFTPLLGTTLFRVHHMLFVTNLMPCGFTTLAFPFADIRRVILT